MRAHRTIRIATEHAREMVRRELERRRGRWLKEKPENLLEYYQARFPEHILGRHIKYLIDVLENLDEGEALILNMPPRHGKTTLLLAYIEWMIANSRSNYSVMYATYNEDVAADKLRMIRSWMSTSVWLKWWGLTFKKTGENVLVVKNGNIIYSLGVGSGFTGRGAHLLIVDDPLKGRSEAESRHARDRIWRWFRSDVWTRLEPNARVIICQTRWHVDDLVGRIKAEQEEDVSTGIELGAFRWKEVVLPALAEAEDPIGREPGEALFPERWDKTKLERIRRFLGEYDWWSLYQQKPYRPEGNVFNVDPKRYLEAPRDGYTVIALDTAASSSDKANRSAFVVMRGVPTRDEQGNITGFRAYVLDVVAGHWRVDELIDRAIALQQQYGVRLVIEDTAQSKPIIDMLKTRGVRVRGVRPVGNKFSRAQPAAAAWNRGEILMPQSAPWLSDALSELQSFTGRGDESDDIVDALAYAYNVLRSRYTLRFVSV